MCSRREGWAGVPARSDVAPCLPTDPYRISNEGILQSSPKLCPCRGSPQGVDRIVALQYVAVIMLGFNNAFTILPVLAVERGVFYRERAAGYYASLAYGLAQGDVEIPFLLLQSIVYTVIFYFMVHLEYSAGELRPHAPIVSLVLAGLSTNPFRPSAVPHATCTA